MPLSSWSSRYAAPPSRPIKLRRDATLMSGLSRSNPLAPTSVRFGRASPGSARMPRRCLNFRRQSVRTTIPHRLSRSRCRRPTPWCRKTERRFPGARWRHDPQRGRAMACARVQANRLVSRATDQTLRVLGRVGAIDRPTRSASSRRLGSLALGVAWLKDPLDSARFGDAWGLRSPPTGADASLPAAAVGPGCGRSASSGDWASAINGMADRRRAGCVRDFPET